MAEQQAQVKAEDGATDAENSAADTGETLEQRLERAVAESRKWEKRAKENSDAAEELRKLKDAQLSETERRQKELDELKAENARMKAEERRREWDAKVASDTGIPLAAVSLLRADTLEQLAAAAKAVGAALGAGAKAQGAPVVIGLESTGSAAVHKAGGGDFIREAFAARRH